MSYTDPSGQDPPAIWAQRINSGQGTQADFQAALAFERTGDFSAYAGFATKDMQKAIERAKTVTGWQSAAELEQSTNPGQLAQPDLMSPLGFGYAGTAANNVQQPSGAQAIATQVRGAQPVSDRMKVSKFQICQQFAKSVGVGGYIEYRDELLGLTEMAKDPAQTFEDLRIIYDNLKSRKFIHILDPQTK